MNIRRAEADDNRLTAALRLGLQAVPPRWQLGLGLSLLALLGAALGAALGAVLGSVMTGTAVGLVVALVGGALSAWASLTYRPQPAVAVMPAATPLVAEDPNAIRDSLTGAFTQRHFIAAADREWSRIRRHGEDAALLMIDADNLRAINEAHGHECGDVVLVQLTRLANATLRQYDLISRFNAGVLVVYLPQTDPIGAIDVAERIRERVANYRLSWPTGPVGVTVSIGVASIGADHAALDSVIGDAGLALREAKAAGRNCVRAAPVPPKSSPASGAAQSDRRAAGPR
jgi:diguanylate cyclase (GGDEF)-like protein